MRFWVFGLLLLICSLPVRGNAADPVGVWRFDEQGFQSALIEMLQPLLAEMPEDMRPQMEQMMLQQFETRRNGGPNVARFRVDGTIVHEDDTGARREGTWRSVGPDTIEITIPGDNDPIEAVIDGDRIIADFSEPEMGMTMQMVWHRQ